MWLLLGMLFSLVIIDGVITRFLVISGLAREGNPFLQNWVDKDIFFYIKVTAAIIVSLVLWDMYKHHPRLSYFCTTCFIIAYAIIVGWNIILLFITRV